eukprot:scaffold23434_cov135-Isochrysis_galbana.AAC.4
MAQGFLDHSAALPLGNAGCGALGHTQPLPLGQITQVPAVHPLRDQHAWRGRELGRRFGHRHVAQEAERAVKLHGVARLVAVVHLLEDAICHDVDDLDQVTVAPPGALDQPQQRRQHRKVERHLPHGRRPLHLDCHVGARARDRLVDLPEGGARDR